MCSSCNAGSTCVNGACSGCSGCIDINTGACVPGTANTACGRNGNFCQLCDTAGGQTCSAGQCVGSTCGPGNCNGCCNGTVCVGPASFSNTQCGNGSPGSSCVSCTSGSSCSASAGQCVPDGVDGGFDLDGGLPLTCTVDDDCGPNACCGMFAGFGLCFGPGQSCFVGVCSPVTRDCQ
jgi:hypothetical protein